MKGRKKNLKEFISAEAEEWTWNPGMSSPALGPQSQLLVIFHSGALEMLIVVAPRGFGSLKQHVVLPWALASEHSEYMCRLYLYLCGQMEEITV